MAWSSQSPKKDLLCSSSLVSWPEQRNIRLLHPVDVNFNVIVNYNVNVFSCILLFLYQCLHVFPINWSILLASLASILESHQVMFLRFAFRLLKNCRGYFFHCQHYQPVNNVNVVNIFIILNIVNIVKIVNIVNIFDVVNIFNILLDLSR